MTEIAVDNVTFGYTASRRVLDGVSLDVRPGRNLGIVGESGSGKTTLLRLLLGLARPTGGSIRFGDSELRPADAAMMRRYRREVQAVFQDPYSSLDPRQRVVDIIAEPLRSLRLAVDWREAVASALDSVGLDPQVQRRYPHEFSGGQRQRIAIARAIVARPQYVLADEAVSALDLSTRIRIVELFRKLSAEITLVFVSHDLGVVAALCEEIVILEHGRVVETGPTRDVLDDPQHPYTQNLLASVPRLPDYHGT